VIRFVRLLCRRFATTLAVVAAFAFVLDGAFGADHHPAASGSGGHDHAHVHSHGPVHASGHQPAGGDIAGSVVAGSVVAGSVVADSVEVAAHDGSAPVSGPDAGASCCSCTCCAALVLPSLNAQAAPFVLVPTVALAQRRHGDGIVPESLRRPPRPLAIA
jgi:hypothetical protein